MTVVPSCKSICESCQQAQPVVACRRSFSLQAILLDQHASFHSLVFLRTDRPKLASWHRYEISPRVSRKSFVVQCLITLQHYVPCKAWPTLGGGGGSLL